MRDYTIITVPQDLLPQIVGELLAFAVDPNHVEVADGPIGRVIHVHPQVADAWYSARSKPVEVETKSEPTPEPVAVPVEEVPAPPPPAPVPAPTPVVEAAPKKTAKPSA